MINIYEIKYFVLYIISILETQVGMEEKEYTLDFASDNIKEK